MRKIVYSLLKSCQAADLLFHGGNEMKRLLGFLTAIATFFIFPVETLADLNSGLVAHYKLDGNADDSENNYEAIPKNVSWTQGKLGQAAKFDGDPSLNQYIDCTSIPVTEKFTYSAWVKREGPNNDDAAVILCKREGTSLSDIFWLAVDGGSGKVCWEQGFGNSNSSLWGTTDMSEDSAWHLVTVTFDGTKRVIYFDGKPEKEVAETRRPNDFDAHFYIGLEADNNDRAWKGLVDDVRIYNRALTANDVNELYDGCQETYNQKILGVPLIRQDYQSKLGWCAAASAQMIIDYYGFKISKQCQLVEWAREEYECGEPYDPSFDCCNTENIDTTYKAACDDECTKSGYATAGILENFGIETNAFEGVLSLEQIKSEITNNRPFIILTKYPSGDGHAIVCYGLREENCAQKVNARLDVRDPASEVFDYRNYDDLLNKDYAEGYWVSTITTSFQKFNNIYVQSDGTCGGKRPCYTSIQSAINAASSLAVIKIADGIYSGDFELAKAKSLTLQGGWEASFGSQSGTTTLQSAPSAANGSLTMQQVKIVPGGNETICSDERGEHDGFFYSWYTLGVGSACITMGPAGNYVTQWSSVENFVGGKGWSKGSSSRTIGYNAGTWSPSGNAYLCLYGWTRNPLVEYYVVDSWGDCIPPCDETATKTGTFETADGVKYDLYRILRKDKPSIEGEKTTFYQYWSVRQDKRPTGINATITFQEHVKAWEDNGWYLGTHDYQLIATEGNQPSSGSSNITVWEE